MREKLLRALREAGGEYLSGEMLCKKFGVSRQAVWKNISTLKEMGYSIESVNGLGYRLESSPDIFYGPDMQSRLPEECLCREVACFDELDSTNTRAKQLAEIGAREGLLVMAERQTAGKGRRGRGWESEAGVNVYMTLLLRPELPPSKMTGLTLLAALAITRGIREVCGVQAEIKWPNDVVLSGKKICGILTEMSSEENFIHYVVVGIGININEREFPDNIKDKATSLYMELKEPMDRCQLSAAVVSALCEYYKRFQSEGDLSFVVEEYNRVMANMNQQVRVYYDMVESAREGDTEEGIARGIDSDGALLVEINGRLKRIISGEVSVRGMYGYV